jgi:hypothetical protein
MRAGLGQRRKRSDRMSRRLSIGWESLEPRIVLDGTGLPGNECPPDLDMSAVGAQSAIVGQPFTLDLIAEGAIIVDRNASGGLTGDDLVFLLDPDVPSDTPSGASISAQGVFSWSPTADQVGTHTIIVILVDEGSPALADVETFQITVETPPNAAPTVDLNGAEIGTGILVTFTEDGGSVSVVSADATIMDADSPMLTSASILLTNLLDATDEWLTVDTSGTNILAVYDETTGVLTLTGTASIADYESVLRTLTYNNTSDHPDGETRQVDVTVNDGISDSATVSANIDVIPVNDAPNLAAIPDVNGVVGTEIEVTVTATDAEGDTLTFFLDPESVPEGATIEQTDGTTAIVRWTPSESDGAGPHEFIVLVSDSALPAGVDSEQFIVTVNLAPAVVDLNGAAEGLDFAATFVEGTGPVTIVDPGATITDSDGSEIAGATVTITNLFDGTDETLSIDTTGTAIAAIYNTATGILTLSGLASLSDYETVLRTLRYDNVSNDPNITDRAITVAVDDGNGLGNASTSVVTIEAVNDAPNLILPSPYDDGETPIDVFTAETISFVATATDVDDDASALTFSLDLDGSGIPNGESLPTIDATTGEFAWTTSIAGCFTITVIVTDAGGMADQETFLVLVQDGPVGAPQAPSGVDEISGERTAIRRLPERLVENRTEAESDPVPTFEAITMTVAGFPTAARADVAFAEFGAEMHETVFMSNINALTSDVVTRVERSSPRTKYVPLDGGGRDRHHIASSDDADRALREIDAAQTLPGHW